MSHSITLISSSLRCIQVIAGVLGRAGEAGQKARLEAAERGHLTFQPDRRLFDPNAAEEAEEEDELLEKNAAAVTEGGLIDVKEAETKMDEVKNRESHRTKDGRGLKKSS